MNTVSLPTPFRFNPWKHHLHWVQYCLQYVINNPKNLKLRNEFIKNINAINSNFVDIYTGKLSPKQLILKILKELKTLEINDKNQFSDWIKQDDYKLITLTDSSVWVLREGVDDELYIHVHPARNSPNITRIHGNSWKTAICTKLYCPQLTELDMNVINEIRITHLNLSPIKSTYNKQRLQKAFKILGILQA